MTTNGVMRVDAWPGDAPRELKVEAGTELLALEEYRTRRVVVVGSGPVGMRFCEELLRLEPNAEITLLGNEAVAPYDRVQLSSLLAGQVKREAIDLRMPDKAKAPNFRYLVATVKVIHRDKKQVEDSLGQCHPYEQLVLATGARAHIPNIPGNTLSGVFQFRTLMDAQSISARVARTVHAVVIGGGLLGLEAARALLKAGTRVTLIQQGPHLMNRQLDQKSSELLRMDVEALGIKVITNAGVREIQGDGRVDAVKTYEGDLINCDTVVLCAGITPNKEIALDAGLKVGRGIVVDERLATNDPDVYAVGECCEHEGLTYGLVSPGFEQAAIAADVIVHNQSRYVGSMAVTRLKVLGQQVCSMGDVVEPAKRPRLTELRYFNAKAGQYRKMTLLKGRVIGALAYGEWSESGRVQSLYQNGFYVWPWQALSFILFGRLWLRSADTAVLQWPERTIVCNCQRISKGEISAVIAEGCTDVNAVQEACGAGSVCGTCKPLVAELLGSGGPRTSEKAWRLVLVTSLLSLLAAGLMAFWPEAQSATSVRETSLFERIYSDKFWKQVTGFSLLGVTVIGLLMSLRKRFDVKWMGAFPYWRALHTGLGLFCVLLLVFHTGFHLGSNLNFLLMLNFLILVVLGSSAGAVVSLGHYLKPQAAMRLKKFWTWLHVIVSWPLPALIGAHIMSVYYF